MDSPHFAFTPHTELTSSAGQIAAIQAKLNKKLGPEYISQRPGPSGGPKLTYAEGWRIINLANEVFGFNGWSSSIVSITTDFVDYSEGSGRFNVGVTAIVRVTLRDGAYHEDVGYGMLENAKSKAAALDKCKKEATTDALKRTLRNFGNLLGNCLYDKSYAQEVVKIKVPPAKFDKNDLYRRPEFQEPVPDALSHAQVAISGPSSVKCHEPRIIKADHETHRPETPITYVPRHLRQEMAATAARNAQVEAQEDPPGITISGTGPVSTGVSGSPEVDARKPSVFATPNQTPIQTRRPLPPQAPPPRPVATSPLARLCSGSFSEPGPASTSVCAESANGTGRDVVSAGRCSVQDDDEEDLFPLSTQDGAFFAMVDLGEGDLGRPIDFDEGLASVTDTPLLKQELESPDSPPLSHHQNQVRDSSGGASSAAGPSSGGSSKTRTDLHVQAVTKPFVNGQTRSGLPDSITSMSTTNTRVGPQDNKQVKTSIVASRFPPGTKPPAQQHTPRPLTPANIQTQSNTSQSGLMTSLLKRKVDLMRTDSGSPHTLIQGLGLDQRQQELQQNTPDRRLDNNEGDYPKRVKR